MDGHYKNGHDYHEQETSATRCPNPQQSSPSHPSFGKTTAKKAFHTLYLLAAAISLVCLALAIVTVAEENVSWRLGINNHQLIVLGFLLGVMNLCLSSVTPMFFYSSKPASDPRHSKTTTVSSATKSLARSSADFGRIMLSLVLALPLGLSVAYKTFTGGESVKIVNVEAYIGNKSYVGVFPPPGMQGLGSNTGVSLFSNATLPFAVAAFNHNGIEPSVPTQKGAQQPYSYNILLIGDESAAALDIPQPSFVSAVQALLAGGESWNFSSTVMATVANYNDSRSQDPETAKADFDEVCKAANGSDDSFPYARQYDLSRQTCSATWSITRSGIQLADAYCNGYHKAPPETQEIIIHNDLSLGMGYMPSLVELLGPFTSSRKNSEWENPYVAISMAAMLWSRITATHNPANETRYFAAPKELADLPFPVAGLIYRGQDKAKYIRPTLKKSRLLYFILAVQPMLIFLILGLSASVFRSTPLDKGFGLISILSGIDHQSLDTLSGAALSGKLVGKVKLVMRPVKGEHGDTIEYRIVLPPSELARSRTEKLTIM
ncbi:MAG: hypothetical protein Q9168_005636 [Polycauliona sp. 1 TL-2023]